MDKIGHYLILMQNIRTRFDIIDELKKADNDQLIIVEMCAFHARKIIEGIAYGCLVAIDNGLGQVSSDIRNKYNAEFILKQIKKRNWLGVFPSPSIIRPATVDEIILSRAKFVIDGQPNKRLTAQNLIDIYESLHPLIHELNPYKYKDTSKFIDEKGKKLWPDLDKIRNLVAKHFVQIGGKGFFCVLWDDVDNQTRLINLEKQS